MFASKDPSKPKEDGKLCRACTDFKSWVANKRGTFFASTESTNKEPEEHPHLKDCPLDKDSLGRNTWSFLHTMAAYYPDDPSIQQQKEMSVLMKLFSKYYPCDHCAKDFRAEIRLSPPVTSSRVGFSLWLCQMHNIVNLKLGKEEFDCSRVDERWKDGWSSGVCDE